MKFLLTQIYSFGAMCLYGVILAFAFDVYRRIAGKLEKAHKYFLNIGDLIFGVLFGVGGFIILVMVNWGDLRFYIFLAIFLGMLFYLFVKKYLFKIG